MTVESTTRRNDYTGNGATATYNFSFRIFAETDLLVTTKDTLGFQTTLAYPTDYSVTGIGLYSGGSITLTAGNLANNYKITIRRKVPLTQLSSIRNQGGYFPDVVENALDRLDMIALAHQDEIDRAIKLPETEAATNSLYLPTLENRVSKFLAFDASGNIIPAAGTSANLGPVSAFIDTLLPAVDASAAQTTLGVSTFVKTFLDDADAATAKSTLVMGRKLFVASGTFVAPAGVTSVLVTLCGGGGGGGGDYLTGGNGGGGGGSSSGVRGYVVAVTPGNSYAVTVGAAGAAGVAGSPTGTSGGTGGNSIFDNGATLPPRGIGGGGGGGASSGSSGGGAAGIGGTDTGLGNFTPAISGANGGGGTLGDIRRGLCPVAAAYGNGGTGGKAGVAATAGDPGFVLVEWM